MKRNGGGWARFFALIAVLVWQSCVGLTANAETPPENQRFGTSYIPPFPAGERYQVLVVGDSLAVGLADGLEEAFAGEPTVTVAKKPRYGDRLADRSLEDVRARAADLLTGPRADIIVVLLGGNDRRPYRVNEARIEPGTDAWTERYTAAIDAYLKRLKQDQAAIYWVGLPIMRAANVNAHAQALNAIFRERAYANGVKFIDTFSMFADEAGNYSAWGPDMAGKSRKLRDDDGVFFTWAGYQKFAHFIELEIKRDLQAARTERDIPLAGAKPEQERAVRRAKELQQQAELAAAGGVGAADKAVSGDGFNRSAGGAQQIAGNQTSTVLGLEIVRPPITAVALGFAAGGRQAGVEPGSDVLAIDTATGTTGIASIASSGISDFRVSGPAVPLSQTPYYRALVRGEALEPKPGRGDDFSWRQAEVTTGAAADGAGDGVDQAAGERAQ